MVEAYENDRFVHSQISAKWATEFINSGQECLNRALELRMPLLAFHGKEDMIVDYRATENIYNNASSLNKELYLFKELYHETMNEIDYKKVVQIVARWIIKVISAKKTVKLAKKKAHKKPITKVWKKAIKKAVKKYHAKAPLSKGAKKITKKKGVKKIVGTTKKTGKKIVKKAVKKTAKKTTKKKK